MCGIVGYIGPKKVVPVIIEGLRKLEYRGYDSAGIAVVNAAGKIEIRRAPGKLKNLEEVLRESPIEGTYGIGHTRWATHGRPTEENAHPHRDCTGQYVVVHNGIIENYLELKEKLQKEGHTFVTETDTEVVAHLVEKNAKDLPFEEAVRKTLKELRGIYSLVFLSAKDPQKIDGGADWTSFGDRPGRRRIFCGQRHSGAAGAHAEGIFPGGWRCGDAEQGRRSRDGSRREDRWSGPPHQVTWDPIMAEKGGYKHFMQKEIFEQPRAVRDTLLGRISQDTGRVFLDEMAITEKQFREFPERARGGLRHKLARGAGWKIHDRAAGAAAGGSGLRERVPVSRPDSRCANADGVHQPIGRDSGHAGGAAGSETEGFAKPGDLQRERLDDHARGRGNDPDACGAGDRRGVHESVYGSAGGHAAAGFLSWPGTRKAFRRCSACI